MFSSHQTLYPKIARIWIIFFLLRFYRCILSYIYMAGVLDASQLFRLMVFLFLPVRAVFSIWWIFLHAEANLHVAEKTNVVAVEQRKKRDHLLEMEHLDGLVDASEVTAAIH